MDPTNIISLDVEYSPTTIGNEPTQIGVVDFYGKVIMNEYIMPKGQFRNYPSKHKLELWSKHTLKKYSDVKPILLDLIKDKTIIGHDLKHDFQVLGLNPTMYKVIDTFYLPPFISTNHARTRLCTICHKRS